MSVTIAAAAFQVGRNGLQRGVMSPDRSVGRNLVRFLFGMPFSIPLTVAALLVTFDPHLQPSAGFRLPALADALSQLLATAALLVAMERAGCAIATALQQSSVPLAAIVAYRHLATICMRSHGWGACTTIGLAVRGRLCLDPAARRCRRRDQPPSTVTSRTSLCALSVRAMARASSMSSWRR
jgi:hypothetical protein